MESKHRGGTSNRPIAGGRGTVDVRGVDKIFKFVATYTSHFCEDETISSPKEVLGAQAGN